MPVETTWGLAGAALLLGFLVPYMPVPWNHQVGERFRQSCAGRRRPGLRTPLTLRDGPAMDAQTLKTELDAASHHAGDGKRAGTICAQRWRWRISSRGYDDVDGRIAPRSW